MADEFRIPIQVLVNPVAIGRMSSIRKGACFGIRR
jgi:hypothetical protein